MSYPARQSNKITIRYQATAENAEFINTVLKMTAQALESSRINPDFDDFLSIEFEHLKDISYPESLKIRNKNKEKYER